MLFQSDEFLIQISDLVDGLPLILTTDFITETRLLLHRDAGGGLEVSADPPAVQVEVPVALQQGQGPGPVRALPPRGT